MSWSRLDWLAQEVALLKQSHSLGTKDLLQGLRLKLEYLEIMEVSKTGLSLQELVGLEEVFCQYANTFMCFNYSDIALSAGGQYRMPNGLFVVATRSRREERGYQNEFLLDLVTIASKLKKMPEAESFYDFLESELALVLEHQTFTKDDVLQFIQSHVALAQVDASSYAEEREQILFHQTQSGIKVPLFYDPLGNHILSVTDPRKHPEKWLTEVHEGAIKALHMNLDCEYYSSILPLAIGRPWENSLYSPASLFSRAEREMTLSRLECRREIAIAAVNEAKRLNLVQLDAEADGLPTSELNASIISQTIVLQRRRIAACEKGLETLSQDTKYQKRHNLRFLQETLDCLIENQKFLKRFFDS